MGDDGRKVSADQFIMIAELLQKAHPNGIATPDHLPQDRRAEQALLRYVGQLASISDEALARLLGLNQVTTPAE